MTNFFQNNLSLFSKNQGEARLELLTAALAQADDVTLAKSNAIPNVQENADIYFVMGFSNTGLLRKVLSLSPKRDVLVFEPDLSVLKFIFTKENLTGIVDCPNFKLIFGQNRNQWLYELKDFFSQDAARLSAYFNCHTISLQDGELYQAFTKSLQGTVDEMIALDFKGNLEDNFWGLVNTLKNFPNYFSYPELESLKGIHKGKPGIVVSTGPSLSQSLPLLKKYQNHAVIFACDSSLKLLLRNGITPDFVGCLERVGVTRMLFRDAPSTPNTCLIAPAVLLPSTFEEFKGPKVRFNRPAGFENWLTDVDPKTQHYVGSSVSHLCYFGLKYLGCDPIYLLGQDSAYDPASGESHDLQVDPYLIEHGKWEKAEDDGVKKFAVAGYDGKQKATNSLWYKFAQDFIYLFQGSTNSVINIMPNGYGIPVPGTKRLDPDSAFGEIAKSASGDKKYQLAIEPVDAKLREKAKCKIFFIRENLMTLQQSSTRILREITEFMIEYDIAVPNQGHDRLYQEFLQKLESYQQELIEMNEGFFDKYFLPLIYSEHVSVGIRLAKTFYQEPSPIKKTYQQLELVNHWYKTILLWSSRAIELIDTLNQRQWHF